MAELGKWLAILGLGSFALNYFNMEFSLLMWIDHWGVSTGNMIRGGATVLGAILFFLGTRNTAGEEENFEDISAPADSA